MPINPNIALGVRPMEQPNMLAQMGQMMAIRQAQQGYESENALRDFYAKGGDLSTAEGKRQVMSLSPSAGMKLIGQQSEISARDIGTAEKSLAMLKNQAGLVKTPQDAANWLSSFYRNPLTRPYVEAVAPMDQALAAIPTDPAALQGWLRNASLKADQIFESADAQLAARTRIQAAGISAAPGHRQADLAVQKYKDELANPRLERVEGDNGFYLYDPRKPNSAVPLGMAPQPGTPAIPPAAPANNLLITGAATPPVAAPNLNALTGGTTSQPGAPTVANAAAADAAARAAAQSSVLRPKGPTGTMAGYRKTADGNLEFIPGGPADPAVQAQQATGKLDAKTLATREAAYPKVTSALNAFDAKTVKFERDINELIDNKKGLDEITGFLAGRTDLSAMSDAGRRALALFNTITAKGGFSELQDMRNASPTGGALGNVSNQEGKQLIDSFGALSRTQSGNDLRKSLNTALSDLQNLRQRMKEAYDLTYEYKVGRAPSSGGGAPSSGGDVIDFGSLK